MVTCHPTAPALQTERLILDPHRAKDLEPLAAMWADPTVYAMIGGQPRSREDVWLRLLRSVGQWALLGYGSWIVRDLASGALLGEVGLLDAERDIDPPLRAPEMGWVLVPAAHGQGLATEAMNAALNWADTHAVAETCCIIDPANLRSIRLAERLGFRKERETRYRLSTTIVFHRAGVSR